MQEIIKEVKDLKVSKKKLEIAMARAKLNRNDLAEKAEMPVNTICSVYSRGTCKPGTVGKIAEALGVDVTEILED
jgi:hypothetical protein